MTAAADTNGASRWRTFVGWLSAPAGLALLSVASGVIGAIVQDIRSDRDLHRTWLQESSKHQMVVRKTFLDEQSVAVDQLYKSIATLRQASDNLIAITRPDFAEDNFEPGAPAKTVERQKQQTRDEFNRAFDAWQLAMPLADFRLSQLRGNSAELQQKWLSVKQAGSSLGGCAEKWYRQVFEGEAVYITQPCTNEESELDRRWSELSGTLRRSREAAWHDWEFPQRWP